MQSALFLKFHAFQNSIIFIFSCFSENIPVFAVSCVSGYGVNGLLSFLHEVSSPHQKILEIAPVLRAPLFNNDKSALMDGLVECWVTRVFNNVPGVGNPVLEVLVRTGQVHNNQRLWLGPDEVRPCFLCFVFFPFLHSNPWRNMY